MIIKERCPICNNFMYDDMNNEDRAEINRLLNKAFIIMNKSKDNIIHPKWDNRYPMGDYETTYQDMYKEYMSKGYTVNADNTVKMVDHFYRIAYDANAFYPTEELANKASQMKKFNDATLLFKWMYDRDFEPDWSTWSGARHYVIYNDNTKKFEANRSATHTNLIYFSSAKIAKACADWLNRVFKGGLL